MTAGPTPRHLGIVGPTASGKSTVAMEVARRLPGPPVEIVSIDSMQVYRGMDIGTAKPPATDRREVPHHLLDLADPWEDFSVARFQRAAAEALGAIEGRGHRALLVGGTGLYLRAVVDGLRIPGRWPDVRAELEAEPDTRALHGRLAVLDPAAAARTQPGNRRRVVRALEVTLGSGRPFSSHGPGLDVYNPTAFDLAGLSLPTELVGERIFRRLSAQLEAGFLDEVEALAGAVRRAAQPLSRTAARALGYRELLAHLDGACTLADAVDEAARRTRSLARRQRAWFRRDPRIEWVAAQGNPVAVADHLLGHWGR